MASRVEAIAQKEQSLRVVERVSPGEQEATTNEKWKEFHEVRKHQRQRISNPIRTPCSVLGPRDPLPNGP